MGFVSFEYYVLMAVALTVYYILPLNIRWVSLLVGSLSYFLLATKSPVATAIFLCVICASYAMGIIIEKTNRVYRGGYTSRRRLILATSIILILTPLAIAKFNPALIAIEGLLDLSRGLIVPLGLSFFTMQIIAYLIDIYKGKIKAQRNIFKYALFIS